MGAVNRRNLMFVMLSAGCGHGASGRAALPPDPLNAVSADDLYRAGLRHRDEGDLVRAEQYLTSAIARGYPGHEARNAVIGVCLSGSRYHAALDHARGHLLRHPEDRPLRRLVAALAYATGDLDAARKELDRILGDAPGDAEARYLIASVCEEDGDGDTARIHLRRYLDLAPAGRHAEDAKAKLQRIERTHPASARSRRRS